MKAATILSMITGASAMAVPALQARDDPPGTEIWKGEDGGTFSVSVGDDLMSFGHIVPSTALDAIRTECSENSCAAGKDVEVDTFLVTVPSVMGYGTKLKMTVHGSFAPDGNDGDKNQLLGLAKAAMQQLYDHGIAKREQGVPYRTKPCQQTPTQGCRYTEDLSYTDQWMSTHNVAVNVYHEVETTDGLKKLVQAGDINIRFHLDEGDSDSGVCGSVASFGSIIAGALNPVAGTGASILGLFCMFA